MDVETFNQAYEQFMHYISCVGLSDEERERLDDFIAEAPVWVEPYLEALTKLRTVEHSAFLVLARENFYRHTYPFESKALDAVGSLDAMLHALASWKRLVLKAGGVYEASDAVQKWEPSNP